MNKPTKTTIIILLLLSAMLLAACSDVKNNRDVNAPNYETPQNLTNADTDGSATSDTEPEYEFNDHQSLFYPVTLRRYSENLQMEDITSYEPLSEMSGFEGAGYIKLEEGWRADFELNLPTAQHYTFGLRMYSDDAVITLSVQNEKQGGFYLKESRGFTDVYLRGVYLEAGNNRVSLAQEKGTGLLDSLTIRDFELDEWADTRFNVTRTPANPNASSAVRLTMEYFGEVFGEKIILAQHVTPGTNAEIGAIFTATGRFPVIRFSDMMRYSRSYTGNKPANDDIDLAVEWARNGGLVGYDWTWYSPSTSGTPNEPFDTTPNDSTNHYYAVMSDFNLNAAFTTENIAELAAESVFSMYQAGTISRSCYELVLEIDHMAENLARLRDENAVVLWRPLHQAGTRWFWWGNCEPEAYKWLWRLMFERFGKLHGLDNLIWVWAGQNAEYYPGDSYVDVIGEDIYNMDNASNLPAFIRTSNYSDRNRFAALTETGVIPSPDLLNRDRAMWLWAALYRGDYLIDHRGRLASMYNQRDRLERAYNHELTITLDKFNP
ncbi:MAG: hypothetical protein FWH20_06335 [Oscillospiraceae bacterium]|nr:hypothetical protein [Oscillospiraceae bacterium]